MDPSFLVAVVSRWVHVGSAIVLIGGLTALRFVVAPALAGNTAALEDIRQRWKKFVHAGIALFLISGFVNYFLAMPSHKGDGVYHGLIRTKIILAFIAFFIASALVGRSAGTQKFRDQSAKWKSVVLLLAALVIAMSGFVKVRDNRKATADGAAAKSEIQPETVPGK
ncbi:MAG: hypothetical protein RLZZ436_1897 [Planctomycetota bacterium]|jgi:uncharacterized membrane protein